VDDRPFEMPELTPEWRAGWPSGPWDDEPDFLAWVEPETGYRCCAMRHLLGNWNGYVKVPPESLLAGMEYNDRVPIPPGWNDKRKGYKLLQDVDILHAFVEALGKVSGDDEPGEPLALLLAVHGGVTYGRKGWYGFSCCHAYDECPGILAVTEEYRKLSEKYGYQYRRLPFVQHECNQLAWQLKELDAAMAAAAESEIGAWQR
jgi:hypothetical protein